jgi:hypothetical protein
MGRFLGSLVLVSVIFVQALAIDPFAPGARHLRWSADLAGRWRVKFMIAGVEKNLILVAQAGGTASFLLLDTAPGDKSIATPLPAAWSQLSNERVSISGETELPLGTCCREIGTLIFKGKFSSSNSISGKLIFVTNTSEEESPYGFHSWVGVFTATRIPNDRKP